MRILLLSRYSPLGASSRYRSYQFLPYLEQLGYQITACPLFDDSYLQELYSHREKIDLAAKIILSYKKRIFNLLRTKFDRERYDLVWLEKEALPWLPDWIESWLIPSNIPYIVDYDDAIFHRYDQHRSRLIKLLLATKIDTIMAKAALVIAGNEYLANRALQAGARVEILPTVIDLDRYTPVVAPQNDVFTIGWIGTPYTARYLQDVRPALEQVCQKFDAQVLVIGSGNLELKGVPLKVASWSSATEVQSLQSIDVGIMPLPDSPFERGKCGFKLIQYMACARPVIGSPVGVNRTLVELGKTGFQAKNIAEWTTALTSLAKDLDLCKSMGQAARQRVEQKYCLQVVAPQLGNILRKAAQKRGVIKEPD
jgi:glycosyltransferase involved in cell wall biosynthesis